MARIKEVIYAFLRIGTEPESESPILTPLEILNQASKLGWRETDGFTALESMRYRGVYEAALKKDPDLYYDYGGLHGMLDRIRAEKIFDDPAAPSDERLWAQRIADKIKAEDRIRAWTLPEKLG